ncbi:MAG: hypothetical protein IKH65_03760, partial [Clostridia bacterium]|nr:hypothetical protein [Clostridia bacterium]
MKDSKEFAREHSYKIPMLDASVIWRLNDSGSGLKLYERVKDSKGNEKYKPNTALFSGALKYCLETEKLESVYKEAFRVKLFYSVQNDNRYSDALISVSFDSTYKEYNVFGKVEGYNGEGKLYVKAGCRYEIGWVIDSLGNKYEITDYICMNGDEILAVIAYVPVSNNNLPVGCRDFGFDTDNNCYTFKQAKTILSTADLRDRLYDKGFTMLNAKGKPVEYVRYKRSAGMSRVGKCYFIRKKMYKKMMAWSDFSPGSSKIDAELKEYGLTLISDPVAHEAYTALTLSTIEDTVEIPLESILFLPDAKFTTYANTICVENKNENVTAEEKTVFNIPTVLWDGEALLDESVFEQASRSDKGMMLLRNRWFKSCAFNTKLQEWFKYNKITEVSQLQGLTLAQDISQIKMVVTDTSLKFYKMLSGKPPYIILYWIGQLYNDGGEKFGIVKSEKPTKYMGGQYVRTSYQLINTINITEEEAKKLIEPANKLKNDIRAGYQGMKYYLDEFRSDDSDLEFNPLLYKKKLVSEILDKYPEFAETKMYYGFRNDIIREINNSVKQGKLLVHGTNAVLFGNCQELLKCCIRDGYMRLAAESGHKAVEAGKGVIYSGFFNTSKKILCIRSPHITMGNITVADNCPLKYKRFFNLTENIVCVDALDSPIQHRLNGCDYDSDTMLVTDDKILTKAADRNYGEFLLPYNRLEFEPAEGKSLAEIDRLISENKIGEIVNLSQKLNTIYWSIINTPDISIISPDELYKDICILAVLSNTEIDKAKRIYKVDVDSVLDELKAKYLGIFGEYFNEPEFWRYINISSGKPKEQDKNYECRSPMAYLYNEACADKTPRSKNGKFFSDLPGIDYSKIKGVRRDEIAKIMDIASKTATAYNRAVTKILSAANKRGRHGQYNTDAGMSDIAVILTSGIERISKLCKTDVHRLAVLREIDNAVRKQKKAETEQWVLLA